MSRIAVRSSAKDTLNPSGVASVKMTQPGSLELSSFQLEGIEDTRIHGAAVLNLTPDHLDRYDSLAAYAAAKARIFRNQEPGDVAS